jgi:hypothetical protein
VGRPRVETVVQVAVSGTLTQWQSPKVRASFEQVAEKIFGLPCFVKGVKAGSVVIDFTVVQYTSTGVAVKSIPDMLADPTTLAAFNEAVSASTGFAVESVPTVSSVTSMTGKGGVVTAIPTLSGGAIAGLVIMCVVVTTLIVIICLVTTLKTKVQPARTRLVLASAPRALPP